MAKDIISGTEDRLIEFTQYEKQSQENEKYLPSPHLLWIGACTIQRGEGFHIHIIKPQEGEEKESVSSNSDPSTQRARRDRRGRPLQIGNK